MKHEIYGTYRIKYVWVGLVFIIISGIVLFYSLHYYGIKYGLLEIIAFVTGLTTTLTLIYHAFSLEHTIKAQRTNNELYQSKYTYNLISEWTKPTMMKSIRVSREILKSSDRLKELKDPSKIEDFGMYLLSNTKERAHLVLILNYFENICTMIHCDHVDQNIVKTAFKSLFISYYITLKHYIDFRQKEYPASWMYFEKISKQWIEEDKMA